MSERPEAKVLNLNPKLKAKREAEENQEIIKQILEYARKYWGEIEDSDPNDSKKS